MMHKIASLNESKLTTKTIVLTYIYIEELIR